MALEENKYEVCDLLVQEGVVLTMKHPCKTVTMKDLPYLISGSLDYVKSSVYLLKCSNSWDPKSDNASEALEKVYCAQKYDVCDLLVREVISLSKKHLPYMILRSVDYVKTKVKQLKHTDSWDPKCNETYKALEEAYEKQKFDICDLLVQEGVSITEGVSLTMKKLSGVIMRSQISLESVRKAIQHLKDMNSCDPKYDDESETLEEAYCAMKYDICDLLIQEGVSLAMKNLLGIITRFQIALKSVKKAILHLKDTNS
ncbi:hypothetical protein CHS0354_009800 [Potamilus streckersoni]|uniref:Uncharacterized protein n=1 Tax=Potamilus streckersoni TaxID=2493646 RepID=A0AAE0SRL9_9BIVA|nr:hypothetical protein CHS0354_009800 [Potamilus streckersoni]